MKANCVQREKGRERGRGEREKDRERERERERGRGRGRRERVIHTSYHSAYTRHTYHEDLLKIALLHSKRLVLSSPQRSYGVDLTKLERCDWSRSVLHVLFSVIDQEPLGCEGHNHKLYCVRGVGEEG